MPFDIDAELDALQPGSTTTPSPQFDIDAELDSIVPDAPDTSAAPIGITTNPASGGGTVGFMPPMFHGEQSSQKPTLLPHLPPKMGSPELLAKAGMDEREWSSTVAEHRKAFAEAGTAKRASEMMRAMPEPGAPAKPEMPKEITGKIAPLEAAQKKLDAGLAKQKEAYVREMNDYIRAHVQQGVKLDAEWAARNMADNIGELLPFSPAKAVKILEANSLIEKWAGGQEISDADKQKVEAFYLENVADKTFGAKVAQTVGAMPAFMAEMFATSGVGAVAKKSTEKLAEKAATRLFTDAVRKKLANKLIAKGGLQLVSGTAAGAAQSTLMPHRIAESAALRMMPGFKITNDDVGAVNLLINPEKPGEDVLPAIAKGYLDTIIETSSERMGPLFDKIGDVAKAKAFKYAVAKDWMKEGGRNFKTLNEAIQKMGFDGIFNEWLEERYGGFLRGLTGLEGDERDNAILRALKESAAYRGDVAKMIEQHAVEFASFAVPQAASSAARGVAEKLDKPDIVAKREALVSEGLEKAKERGITDPDTLAKLEQLARKYYASNKESERVAIRAQINKIGNEALGTQGQDSAEDVVKSRETIADTANQMRDYYREQHGIDDDKVLDEIVTLTRQQGLADSDEKATSIEAKIGDILTKWDEDHTESPAKEPTADTAAPPSAPQPSPETTAPQTGIPTDETPASKTPSTPPANEAPSPPVAASAGVRVSSTIESLPSNQQTYAKRYAAWLEAGKKGSMPKSASIDQDQARQVRKAVDAVDSRGTDVEIAGSRYLDGNSEYGVSQVVEQAQNALNLTEREGKATPDQAAEIRRQRLVLTEMQKQAGNGAVKLTPAAIELPVVAEVLTTRGYAGAVVHSLNNLNGPATVVVATKQAGAGNERVQADDEEQQRQAVGRGAGDEKQGRQPDGPRQQRVDEVRPESLPEVAGTAAAEGEKSQGAAAPVASFTTSRGGSKYVVEPDGTTTRTKATSLGHSDAGTKETSLRTVYVDKQTAEDLGIIYATGAPKGKETTISIDDSGTITLTDWSGVNKKTGETFANKRTRTYTSSSTPEVGLHPLEKLSEGGWHVGSTIDKVQRSPESDTTRKQETQDATRNDAEKQDAMAAKTAARQGGETAPADRRAATAKGLAGVTLNVRERQVRERPRGAAEAAPVHIQIASRVIAGTGANVVSVEGLDDNGFYIGREYAAGIEAQTGNNLAGTICVTSADSPNLPVIHTLAHECGHYIKEMLPKVWAKIDSAISPLLRDVSIYQIRYSGWMYGTNKAGTPKQIVPIDAAHEELVCNVIGHAALKPEFWNALAAANVISTDEAANVIASLPKSLPAGADTTPHLSDATKAFAAAIEGVIAANQETPDATEREAVRQRGTDAETRKDTAVRPVRSDEGGDGHREPARPPAPETTAGDRADQKQPATQAGVPVRDQVAYPEAAEARIQQGLNPFPENETVPNVLPVSADVLRGNQATPITGHKAEGLQIPYVRGLYASLAKWSKKTADMFFGAGTVSFFLHKSGGLKPGHVVSEFETQRVTIARQLNAGNAEAIADEAEKMIRYVKDLGARAEAAVSGSKKIKEAEERFKAFIATVPTPPGVSERDRKAKERIGLLRFGDSVENKMERVKKKTGEDPSDAVFEEALVTFAGLNAMRWWAELSGEQMLAPGQQMMRRRQQTMSWIDKTEGLRATLDALSKNESLTVSARKQAERQGDAPLPPALKNTPEAAAFAITIQWILGSNMAASTEIRQDGTIAWFSMKNEAESRLPVDSIRGVLRNMAAMLKDADIRQADSWPLMVSLAQESNGATGFIVDPSYFASIDDESGERGGTKNYNRATEIGTPADLLYHVDRYLMPAWKSGSRLVLTNTWEDGVVRELRNRGFTVLQFNRGVGAKKDAEAKNELIAYNFNPTTGEVSPQRMTGDWIELQKTVPAELKMSPSRDQSNSSRNEIVQAAFLAVRRGESIDSIRAIQADPMLRPDAEQQWTVFLGRNYKPDHDIDDILDGASATSALEEQGMKGVEQTQWSRPSDLTITIIGNEERIEQIMTEAALVGGGNKPQVSRHGPPYGTSIISGIKGRWFRTPLKDKYMSMPDAERKTSLLHRYYAGKEQYGTGILYDMESDDPNILKMSPNRSVGTRGEYWYSDGQLQFADGDIGDMNHEGFAIQAATQSILDELGIDYESDEIMLSEHEDEIDEELGLDDPTASERKAAILAKLKEEGAEHPEATLDTAYGIGDAREYGVEHLGWLRVKGDNIDVWKVTGDTMRQAYDAITSAMDEEGVFDEEGDIADEDITANLYEASTQRLFRDVPLNVLKEGNAGAMRLYGDRTTEEGARFSPMRASPKGFTDPAEWLSAWVWGHKDKPGNVAWLPSDSIVRALAPYVPTEPLALVRSTRSNRLAEPFETWVKEDDAELAEVITASVREGQDEPRKTIRMTVAPEDVLVDISKTPDEWWESVGEEKPQWQEVIVARSPKAKAQLRRVRLSLSSARSVKMSPSRLASPDVSALGFYSQLGRVITQKMPNRASVANVRGIIDPAKGSGIKKDEIEWSGIGDFLDTKQPGDMVTKEEVLAAVKPVTIREVVKGAVTNDVKLVRFDELSPEQQRNIPGHRTLSEQDPRAWIALDRGEYAGTADSSMTEMEARDDMNEARMGAEMTDIGAYTKFSKYQLPGGENYREVLLTMPQTTRPSFDQWLKDNYAISSENLTDSRRRVLETKYGNETGPDPFTSTHFDEPNIIVHARVNDRDVDEKALLHIEEIQSDWHQKGREKGYRGKAFGSMADVRTREDKSTGGWIASTSDTDERWGATEYEAKQNWLKAKNESGVPDAPFKDTSKGWARLMFKRLLGMAVSEGKAGLTWTTGAQQTDRYNEAMRQNVDKITTERIKVTPHWIEAAQELGMTVHHAKQLNEFVVTVTSSGEQSYFKTHRAADAYITDQWQLKHPESAKIKVEAYKDGRGVFSELVPITGTTTIAGKSDVGLEDVIGKNLAKKVREGDEKTHEFTGDDLSIGGGGMREFYNVILPSIANDLGKKFGAKAGMTTIQAGDRNESVHSFEIPPAMRDSIAQGQPLFSPARDKWQNRRMQGSDTLAALLTNRPIAIPATAVEGRNMNSASMDHVLGVVEYIEDSIKEAKQRKDMRSYRALRLMRFKWFPRSDDPDRLYGQTHNNRGMDTEEWANASAVETSLFGGSTETEFPWDEFERIGIKEVDAILAGEPTSYSDTEAEAERARVQEEAENARAMDEYADTAEPLVVAMTPNMGLDQATFDYIGVGRSESKPYRPTPRTEAYRGADGLWRTRIDGKWWQTLTPGRDAFKKLAARLDAMEAEMFKTVTMDEEGDALEPEAVEIPEGTDLPFSPARRAPSRQDWNKIIKEYGIAENPLDAGFITPDGRLVDLNRNGTSARFTTIVDHHEVISDVGILNDVLLAGVVRVELGIAPHDQSIGFEIASIPSTGVLRAVNRIMEEYEEASERGEIKNPSAYVDWTGAGNIRSYKTQGTALSVVRTLQRAAMGAASARSVKMSPARRDTIDVDGAMRPVTDSTGLRIHTTDDAMRALQDEQRGDPESMFHDSSNPGAGNSQILQWFMEHTGDLIHRLAYPKNGSGWGGGGWEYGYDATMEKVGKLLRAINDTYDIGRQARDNAKYLRRPVDAYVQGVRDAGINYANAYSKLTPITQAQWHAKEAAMSLGMGDYDALKTHLEAIRDGLKNNPEWYFEPRKSATGNTVAFSKDNPDIRMSPARSDLDQDFQDAAETPPEGMGEHGMSKRLRSRSDYMADPNAPPKWYDVRNQKADMVKARAFIDQSGGPQHAWQKASDPNESLDAVERNAIAIELRHDWRAVLQKYDAGTAKHDEALQAMLTIDEWLMKRNLEAGQSSSIMRQLFSWLGDPAAAIWMFHREIKPVRRKKMAEAQPVIDELRKSLAEEQQKVAEAHERALESPVVKARLDEYERNIRKLQQTLDERDVREANQAWRFAETEIQRILKIDAKKRASDPTYKSELSEMMDLADQKDAALDTMFADIMGASAKETAPAMSPAREMPMLSDKERDALISAAFVALRDKATGKADSKQTVSNIIQSRVGNAAYEKYSEHWMDAIMAAQKMWANGIAKTAVSSRTKATSEKMRVRSKRKQEQQDAPLLDYVPPPPSPTAKPPMQQKTLISVTGLAPTTASAAAKKLDDMMERAATDPTAGLDLFDVFWKTLGEDEEITYPQKPAPAPTEQPATTTEAAPTATTAPEARTLPPDYMERAKPEDMPLELWEELKNARGDEYIFPEDLLSPKASETRANRKLLASLIRGEMKDVAGSVRAFMLSIQKGLDPTKSLVDAVAERIKREMGFKNPNDARAIAAALTDESSRIVEDYRRRRIEQMLSSSEAKKMKGDTERAARDILELQNLGALSGSQLDERMAAALGLPAMTPEIEQELLRLAQAIADAPLRFLEERAKINLLNFIHAQLPTDWPNASFAVLYGNMLSGFRTVFINMGQSLMGVITQLASDSIARPHMMPTIIASAVRGLAAGGVQFAANMKNAESSWGQRGKWTPSSPLDLGPFERKFGKAGKVLDQWKYVSRWMRAQDAILYKPGERAALNLLAYKDEIENGTPWNEAVLNAWQKMSMPDAVREHARQIAEQYGLSRLDEALAREELWMDEYFSVRRQEQAERKGKHSTFNDDEPDGMLGVLYRMMRSATVRRPGAKRTARDNVVAVTMFTVMPFLRIVASALQFRVELMPIFGAIPAIYNTMHDYQTAESDEERQNAIERGWDRARRQLIGALLALWALYKALDEEGYLLPDDDPEKEKRRKNPKFLLTAQGPRSRAEQDLLRQQGWRPFSMRIGNTWIYYGNTPLALALALPGAWMDHKRWFERDKTRDRDDLENRGWFIATSIGKAAMSASFMQGALDIMQSMTTITDDSPRAIKSVVAGLASRVVPSFIPQTISVLDEKVYDKNTISEHILDRTGVGKSMLRPAVNQLGDEILGNRAVFYAPQRSLDEVTRFISERDIEPGFIEKSRKIMLPTQAKDDAGRTIKMAQRLGDFDDIYYAMQKESGRRFKEYVATQMDRVNSSDDQKIQKWADSARDRIRDRVEIDVQNLAAEKGVEFFKDWKAASDELKKMSVKY